MLVRAGAGAGALAGAAEFALERREALARAGGHAIVRGESTYRPACPECGGQPVVGAR